ncbi:MAG TPA: DUF4097 family beta strand repeat-containing protein [Gammaproteobacteria bacterium]|nr:DUF4097 family beta strand repeat-containing protein [Gammaproteobacteria bacterium]
MLVGLLKNSETWCDSIHHIFTLWLPDSQNRREISFSGIERIQIHTDNQRVLIKGSSLPSTKISFDANSIQINRFRKSLVINNKSSARSELVIVLPKKLKFIQLEAENALNATFDKIRVNALSIAAKKGKVELKQTQANEAKINLNAGKLFIQDSNMYAVSINTNTGAIRFDNMLINTANIKNTSGSFLAARMSMREAIINSVSGNIRWEGFVHYADLETDSGKIYCLLPKDFHGKFKAISGSGSIEKPLDRDGSDTIEIKTISGNVKVIQK